MPRLFRLLPALLLSLLCVQPLHAASIAGQWVWRAGAAPSVNEYVYFRRAFTLAATPSAATVRVTADTRYMLYVNGQLVGRGPARAPARFQAFDTWDIAPYLTSGKNVLAALAHHPGAWTFRNEAGRAGFLCDAAVTVAGQTQTIRTDGTWKALTSAAWDPSQARMNIALGFAEVYDARKAPVGWTTAAFDDAAWPAAAVLGPAGVAPWTNLTASDIPPNREALLRPAAVVDTLAVQPPPDAAEIPFSRLYDGIGWATGYACTWLYAPKGATVTLRFGGDDGYKVWLNDTLVARNDAAHDGYPGERDVPAALKAGWNRLMVKSVKIVGAWSFYFSVVGPSAGDIVISSEKDAARPNVWRVSQAFPFDGSKGILAGMDRVFAPESDVSLMSAWRQITAPVQPWQTVAGVMRFETRSRPTPARVQNAGNLSGGGAAVFQNGGTAVLDMGREVSGFPTLTVKGARGGEIVDVGYAEALEDGAGNAVRPGATGVLNPQRGGVNYADRFVCRAGDNTLQPFAKRAFRYLQIDVRNAAAPVTVSDVALTLSTYPVTERGRFTSSDPLLNRIWETGRWTLQLSMDDAYMDGPWRERAQWWGDAHLEARSNDYAFGDTKLIRRGLLQAAQAQDAEGVVPGIFPTDWNGARLPSYSLLWVDSVWNYYTQTGDASVFAQVQPAIDRLMAFFDTKTNPTLGLLEDAPYWVFIDWAPGMDGQRIGASASLNAFYYRALISASKIATAAGDPTRAGLYADKAAALKTAFNARFWNPTRQVYEDLLTKGARTGRVSQHANVLAVALDLAPPERRKPALDHALGDPDMVQIGTPYFASWLLDALSGEGRDAEMLNVIRNRWGAMLVWGATTFWEKWEPTDSLSHGWSTAPVRALPARILGVRPTAPGFAEWEMAPALADLQWADGVVPTPKGDVEAFWSRRPNGVYLQVVVPEGTTAHIKVPLAGLETARWMVMQGTRPAAGAVPETVPGHWAVRLTRPGRYDIVAVRPS
jgi:hypothetical protein